jgi:hypothetical protein
MSKLVLRNVVVSIAGTDITDFVAAVTLNTESAEIPTTSFGSGGAVTRVSGLIDNSVTFSIHNSYPTVDALLFPLVGSTAVPVIVKPAGTANAGTATPHYSFSTLITNWTPVNGAVGELNTADVTFPISGAITRSTA